MSFAPLRKLLTCLIGAGLAATVALAQDETVQSGVGYEAKPIYKKFVLKKGSFEPISTTPFEMENEMAERDDYRAVYNPAPFYPPRLSQRDGSDFGVEAAPVYRTGWQYGGNTPGSFPPDNTIAVGPSDMVASVNTNLRVYDLSGVQQTSANWSTLLGTTQFLSDPNFRYDTYRGRFIGVIIAIDNITTFNNARWWILYSDDNTAEGTWTAMSLNARFNGSTEEDIWADYPHIGFTNDAIAVSAIMFATPAGSGDSYGKCRFIDAADVYDGGGYAYKDFWNFTSDGTPDKRVFPATSQSSPSRFWVLSSKEGGASNLTLREFDDTAGGNNGAQTNLLTTSLVPVNAYATPPDGRQPGGATAIDNIDSRILQCEYTGGKVFATLTSAEADTTTGGNKSTIRAYRLQTVIGAAPTVQVDAGLSSNTYDYYYPGIVATADGDAIIVFGRSGTAAGAWPEVRWTSFLSTATALEGSALAKAGEDTYSRVFNGRNRWGDYFTCALDPYDDRTVWMHGEYAELASGGVDQYGCWIFAANYKPDHVISVANASIAHSDTGTLSCTVTSSAGGAVPSAVVNWTVNGVSQGTSVTNASGVATKSYTVPSGTLPGLTQTISCTVNRTTTLNEATSTATLTVLKANTAIQISNETTQVGGTVTFLAQLIRTTDSLGLSGKTINFYVNGIAIGSATTNASGFAQINYTAHLNPGSYTAYAIFAGDTYYNSKSDLTGVLTVNKADTTINVPTVNGTIGSTISVTATLTRNTDSLALSGKTISFIIDGVAAGSAVTNASGVATISHTVAGGVLGNRTITANFAGDTVYNPSAGTGTLVRYANTTLTAPSGANQRTKTVTLSSTLRRAHDSALIIGATVNFLVDGASVGSGVTNASGIASFVYTIPAGAAFGAHTTQATFAGSGFLNASSSALGTLTVNLPSFNGDLTLLNWGGSNAVNATVRIFNSANVLVQGPSTVSCDAGGNWSLPTSLAAGTYKVKMKTSHWLTKQVTGVVLNTTTGTSTIIHDLFNGDCDGNDIVDIADYTILALAFDAVLDTDPGTPGNQSSPNWNAQADLDGNGIVDIADYTILATNFDRVGD